MNKTDTFINLLSEKNNRLSKIQNQVNEIGMGTLEDHKLSIKRNNLRKEITDLTWQIKEIKKIIKEELANN